MNITFGGAAVAVWSGSDGDLVSNFMVTPNRVIQQATGLRWAYAEHYDRGNISHTVTFQVAPPPEATPEDALRELSMRFENLPGSGALVWQEEGKILQMPSAVLQTVTQVRPRTGVSNVFAFVFVGGQVQLIADEDPPGGGDPVIYSWQWEDESAVQWENGAAMTLEAA